MRDLQCLEGMVSVVAICVARLKQLTPVLRPHRLAEYDPTTLTADIKPMLCVALAHGLLMLLHMLLELYGFQYYRFLIVNLH